LLTIEWIGLQGPISGFLYAPLLSPTLTTDRDFLGSGMALSTVPSAFRFLAWVIPLYLELYIEIIAYPWDKGFIF
jgi:hypothetical protein